MEQVVWVFCVQKSWIKISCTSVVVSIPFRNICSGVVYNVVFSLVWSAVVVSSELAGAVVQGLCLVSLQQ